MRPKVSNLESAAVRRLLTYSLITATSYIVTRTAGDSLFLSRIGSNNLALVFVASGCCTAVVASLWYLLTRKLSVSRSIQLSGLTFGCLTWFAWWALPTFHHSFWLIGALYLLTEVKGCINAINIVSALNSTLGSRSEKSSWARVGLGVPLAGILIGGLLAAEAGIISLRTWLLVACILDFASALIVVNLGKLRLPARNSKSTDASSQLIAKLELTAKNYACSTRFRVLIGILISAKVIVLTLVTFEWKVAVNEFYHGDEPRLVLFFGIFYAIVGVTTLLLQHFVTGRLLRKRSLAIPILVMPFAFLIMGTALIFGAGLLFMLIVATAGKSMEVWRRSVHDTTINLLYTNIESSKRRSMIAFNSALVKPISEVAASLSLLIGIASIHRSVLLASTMVWLAAALALLSLLRRLRKDQSSQPPSDQWMENLIYPLQTWMENWHEPPEEPGNVPNLSRELPPDLS